MTDPALDPVLEAIYASVNNDNEDLDAHIAQLKAVLTARNEKTVVFNPTRLAHGNREGRKLMQSYFKKRGILVTFAS